MLKNNRTIVKDTKVVWNRDGFLYQVSRKRCGFIDTISLSYPIKSGVKTISKKIIAPLGGATQFFLELGISHI